MSSKNFIATDWNKIESKNSGLEIDHQTRIIRITTMNIMAQIMFNLPKYWTGVEKRKDGALLYRGRVWLSFFGKKKDTYVINKRTYYYLKTFVFIGILIVVPFFAWLKVNYTPSITTLVFILFGGFIMGEIGTRLTDNFVKKRALKIYEEQ